MLSSTMRANRSGPPKAYAALILFCDAARSPYAGISTNESAAGSPKSFESPVRGMMVSAARRRLRLLLTPGAAVRPDDQQSVPGVAAGRPRSRGTSARWRLSWIYTTKATAISARTSSRISRVLRKTRPPPVTSLLPFRVPASSSCCSGRCAYEVPPEVTPTTVPASAGWMARGTSRRGTGS